MQNETLTGNSPLVVDDIKKLPHLFADEPLRESLPSGCAIFFALDDKTSQILKIGKAPNLAVAIEEQLKAFTNLTLPRLRLSWIEVPDPELASKLQQSFTEQFQPLLNGLEGKLKRVEDLNIGGWYDFQKINGEIWGFYGSGVMPVPVPKTIALEYKQELRENAKALAKIEEAFGQKFTTSLRESSIKELEARIKEIESERFVCPLGCYVSEYAVKRQYGIYYYYKLMAQEPIFPARSKQNSGKLVKTLHLGRFNSLAEAQEAAGWTARRAIDKIKRQIEMLENYPRWLKEQEERRGA